MKITSLTISNFIGARDVQLTPSQPIQIVAGDNEAGKSSTAEAIACALGQDPLRVTLKKDYSQLVTAGAKAAAIKMATSLGEVSMRYPSADLKGVILPDARFTIALPAVLKPGLFARSKPDERRRFLFELMQITNTPDATLARMLGEPYNVREDVASASLAWLPGGFTYAAGEAKKQAAEARGAWRAVTGENYGGKKAADWKPEAPATCDPPDREAVTKAQQAADAARQELGRLQGLQQAHSGREERVAALRETAAGFAAAQEKFQKADELHKQWVEYVAKQEAKVAAMKPPPAAKSAPEIVCTGCGLIGDVKDGKLLPGVQQPLLPAPDPAALAEAEKKLTEAKASLAKAKSNRERDKEARDAADAAAKQLAAVDEAAGEPPSELEIRNAKIAVDEAVNALENARAKLHVDEHAERQTAEAGRAKQAADKHHADVEAWTACEAALSPSGIPGELLAQALDPVNAKLAEHARKAGWSVPMIDADMNLTGGGCLYNLLSESAQWRWDAMFSAVVSEIAGINMLMLDRFDVLSAENRKKCIGWLLGLKWCEQAWVFATLKEPPKLPAACEVHWFEKGVGR